MRAEEALGAAMEYTKQSLLGGGAVVGKNVVIQSITPIDGGNRVTFGYTLDNGTPQTQFLDIMNGKDGDDTVSQEEIQEAVDSYLNENPVMSGATDEQAEQIEENTQAIGKLQETSVKKDDFPSYDDVLSVLNESEGE